LKADLASFIRNRLGESDAMIQDFVTKQKQDANDFAIQQRAAIRADVESFLKVNLGSGHMESIIADLREVKTPDVVKMHTRREKLGGAKMELQAGQWSVNLGEGAGGINQGNGCTAIGHFAGNVSQGEGSTALGVWAGYSNQGSRAVALGVYAGTHSQGANAVALGHQAGYLAQGRDAVAIGLLAGSSSQGASSIAIGNGAGIVNQHASTIILNAEANAHTGGLNSLNPGSFYVKPIRSIPNYAGSRELRYDPSSGEIFYVTVPTAAPTTAPTAPTAAPTRRPSIKPKAPTLQPKAPSLN
jgi:hypothetical protein